MQQELVWKNIHSLDLKIDFEALSKQFDEEIGKLCTYDKNIQDRIAEYQNFLQTIYLDGYINKLPVRVNPLLIFSERGLDVDIRNQINNKGKSIFLAERAITAKNGKGEKTVV